MTARRPLGVLLDDLASSAFAATSGGPVRACSIAISLPIDLRIELGRDGPAIIGDVPQFVTRTAFDPDPARLSVEWRAVATGAPA